MAISSNRAVANTHIIWLCFRQLRGLCNPVFKGHGDRGTIPGPAATTSIIVSVLSLKSLLPQFHLLLPSTQIVNRSPIFEIPLFLLIYFKWTFFLFLDLFLRNRRRASCYLAVWRRSLGVTLCRSKCSLVDLLIFLNWLLWSLFSILFRVGLQFLAPESLYAVNCLEYLQLALRLLLLRRAQIEALLGLEICECEQNFGIVLLFGRIWLFCIGIRTILRGCFVAMHFLLMDLNPPFNLIIDHQLDLGLNVLIQFLEN